MKKKHTHPNKTVFYYFYYYQQNIYDAKDNEALLEIYFFYLSRDIVLITIIFLSFFYLFIRYRRISLLLYFSIFQILILTVYLLVVDFLSLFERKPRLLTRSKQLHTKTVTKCMLYSIKDKSKLDFSGKKLIIIIRRKI